MHDFEFGNYMRFDGILVYAYCIAEDCKGKLHVIYSFSNTIRTKHLMPLVSEYGIEAWNDRLELPQIPADDVPNDFHGATEFRARFTRAPPNC